MPETPKKRRSFLFKFLMAILVLVLLVVGVILGVGLFVLDGNYDLRREITIKAPAEAVHQQVGDLQQWPNWLPFTKNDPSVNTTIEKPTGKGAHQHWTSKNGNGELTFTESDEQRGIKYEMLFDKKWASNGSMTYAQIGDDTRVIWRMHGHNDDFFGKWMAVAMPYMVGKQFEEGLADLKTTVEGRKVAP